jgi:hypothetical protein
MTDWIVVALWVIPIVAMMVLLIVMGVMWDPGRYHPRSEDDD